MSIYWIFGVVQDEVIGKVGVLQQIGQDVATRELMIWGFNEEVEALRKSELNKNKCSKVANVVICKDWTTKQVLKLLEDAQADSVYKELQDVVCITNTDEIAANLKPTDPKNTLILGAGKQFHTSSTDDVERVRSLF